MSVIACRVFEEGFEMCSDSIVTIGSTQSRGENEKFSKLFEANNVVVGGCGFAEGNSLMELFLQTHGISEPTEKGILEFLNEFADWKMAKTDDRQISNSYLIGYKYKVFNINGWSISEVKTYSAIGAGMDYALPVLYLGFSAEKAVETAIELCIYCESPVVKIFKRKI